MPVAVHPGISYVGKGVGAGVGGVGDTVGDGVGAANDSAAAEPRSTLSMTRAARLSEYSIVHARRESGTI